MQMVPQKSAGKVTKSKESHRHASLSSSQMSVLLLVTSLPSIQVSYAKQHSMPDSAKAGTQKSLHGSQAS